VSVFNDNDRDIRSIRLPTWGRVAPAEGTVPWLVVDDDGVPVEPIRRYLADFVARETSLGSVRSYAYALLRWWRWLRAVGLEWERRRRPSPRPGAVAQAGDQATSVTANGVGGHGGHGQPDHPQAAPR
jgi:hypothetical protein